MQKRRRGEEGVFGYERPDNRGTETQNGVEAKAKERRHERPHDKHQREADRGKAMNSWGERPHRIVRRLNDEAKIGVSGGTGGKDSIHRGRLMGWREGGRGNKKTGSGAGDGGAVSGGSVLEAQNDFKARAKVR
jgi:hypothetical protein